MIRERMDLESACDAAPHGAEATGEAIRYAIGDCWLGAVVVAASGKGICAILLGDDAAPLLRDLRQRLPDAQLSAAPEELEGIIEKVAAVIAAPSRALDLPLDLRGTAFEQRVWEALRALPPGTTTSYGEIAERIGAPRRAQDVAAACAANAIAVAVPCHRVRRKDGSLSGYRWGWRRKRALLEREVAA
jgi:AraC family transcriptional regulator of adaptative response/methylated-DNA-[protein]-cysteine methyltransferase